MSNTKEQAQLELALAIMKAGHPFLTADKETPFSWWYESGTAYDAIAKGKIIRPTFIQAPLGEKLHNPMNLSAEQVGVGYRLISEYEQKNDIHKDKADIWFTTACLGIGWHKANTNLSANFGASIRVPSSCPFAKKPMEKLCCEIFITELPPTKEMTLDLSALDDLFTTSMPLSDFLAQLELEEPTENYEPDAQDQNPEGITPDKIPDGYRFATKYETDNNIYQDKSKYFGFGNVWKRFKSSTMRENYGVSIVVPITCEKITKKPEWVLPEPPAGKKWQRQDFTEADLPPGYRPFLDGEKHEADDEMLSFGSPQTWTKYSVMQKNKEYPDGHAYSSSNKTRTKRPLPPQFKHLDPKDIIPGSVLRRDDWKPDEWEMITAVYWNRVKVAGSDTSYSYGEIMDPKWSIKYPNSTVWERCHKALA